MALMNHILILRLLLLSAVPSSVEAPILKGSLAPFPRRLRISMFSHDGDGADS